MKMPLLLRLVVFAVWSDALFVTQGRVRRRPPTMIISPEAMISAQKIFNRRSFDATVDKYMVEKKLTRDKAELEFATYLLDPDAYVLEKAAKDKLRGPKLRVKKAEPGQRRSPLLQAYIDDGGDEVKERIENFERQSSYKAFFIIGIFSTLLLGKDFIPQVLHP